MNLRRRYGPVAAEELHRRLGSGQDEHTVFLPAKSKPWVIAQSLAELKPIAIIPPTAFWPQPKVESVMLTLIPRPPDELDLADAADFVRFVRRVFTFRRKTLKRIVRDWELEDPQLMFHRAGVNPSARPEELTVRNWHTFHHAVYAQVNRT